MRKEGAFQKLCQSDAHSQKKCWILFKSMMQENPKLWIFLVFWSVAMAFWCKNPWRRSRTTNQNTQVSWNTDFLAVHCCSSGNVTFIARDVFPINRATDQCYSCRICFRSFHSRPSSKVWKYSSAITYRYSYSPHTGKAN